VGGFLFFYPSPLMGSPATEDKPLGFFPRCLILGFSRNIDPDQTAPIQAQIDEF
jgi:hypothetical protein